VKDVNVNVGSIEEAWDLKLLFAAEKDGKKKYLLHYTDISSLEVHSTLFQFYAA